VRATGGNNAERVLMVTTYGAFPGANAVNALVVPTDSVSDRIVVTLHFYEPYRFALHTGGNPQTTWSRNNSADTSPIIERIDRAYNTFVSRGIPVAITETGVVNRDNIDARAEWAEFKFSYARSRGIPAFWWDSGTHTPTTSTGAASETFGIFNRRTGAQEHPAIISAIMRATQ
jgi:endoglucanase